MGQFSWLDCKTREQVLDDVERKVYVLVPKEFGGGHIEEDCYNGYGDFGGKDIYELVVEWNKGFIPELLRRADNAHWKCMPDTEERKSLLAYYNDEKFDCELRRLGIVMACFDEDNFALEYPIKITHNKYAIYENCEPSKTDPNQGWLDGDYDD